MSKRLSNGAVLVPSTGMILFTFAHPFVAVLAQNGLKPFGGIVFAFPYIDTFVATYPSFF